MESNQVWQFYDSHMQDLRNRQILDRSFLMQFNLTKFHSIEKIRGIGGDIKILAGNDYSFFMDFLDRINFHVDETLKRLVDNYLLQGKK